MKVGTDGVLLGAWAIAGDDTCYAVDLGAGSGVVSLLLAQRFAGLTVTAVEKDGEACLDCRDNFARSPWADRLAAECCDAIAFRPATAPGLVVSNPPFFTETLKSPDAARASARHAGVLSPLSVVEVAAEILDPSGSVALIFPTAMADEVIYRGEMLHLKERRRLDIATREGRAPERTLLQLSRIDGPPRRAAMAIRHRTGGYTDDYRALVAEYYMHLPND